MANSIYTRGTDVKLYTGYDKIQAVDELGKYLSNTNSIYEALVKPITSGRVSKDIQIKVIASQIKYNMIWEAEKQDGKIHVVGKSKYYPVGVWNKRYNNKGEVFEVLTLDILGADADIFDGDYLEKRIANFVNMAHEVNLLYSLKKMGLNVRGSNEYEDRVKKVDLIITNARDEKIGISVFKSSDKTALDKLKISNRFNYKHRFAYNVYKYGKPSDLENVKRWYRDCKNGKNKIVITETGVKYITE